MTRSIDVLKTQLYRDDNLSNTASHYSPSSSNSAVVRARAVYLKIPETCTKTENLVSSACCYFLPTSGTGMLSLKGTSIHLLFTAQRTF